MELETINNLYLELSQIATATTNREIELLKIVKTADSLEDWLSKNTGTNDEWPIEIKADQEGAEKLSELLTSLKESLLPYREVMKPYGKWSK